MQQISNFITFLIENTFYSLSDAKLSKCAALDQNNDIIFVNLRYIKRNEDIKQTSKSFWTMIKEIFDINPFKVEFPISVNRIFVKHYLDRDHKDFFIFKDYLDNYEKNSSPVENEVMKYLEDYDIVKEIEGHKCHIKIYKRSLLSRKKFRQLVLKSYNFVISENLKKLIRKRWIIETWTKENKSFILMNYIKARRLRDLIPELDYDQKILILSPFHKFHLFSKG